MKIHPNTATSFPALWAVNFNPFLSELQRMHPAAIHSSSTHSFNPFHLQKILQKSMSTDSLRSPIPAQASSCRIPSLDSTLAQTKEAKPLYARTGHASPRLSLASQMTRCWLGSFSRSVRTLSSVARSVALSRWPSTVPATIAERTTRRTAGGGNLPREA